MSRPAEAIQHGSSLGRSLRVFGYCATVLLAGGVPVFGMLEALSTPDPPLRMAVFVAWFTRGTVRGLAGSVLEPVRGILLIGLLALVAVPLLRLVAAVVRAVRASAGRASTRAIAAPPADRPTAADQARAGVADLAAPPRSRPTAAGQRVHTAAAPVVVVGAVTGTLGRAWLDGRPWTVRSAGGCLRDGGRYVVVGRLGETLDVATPPGPRPCRGPEPVTSD
jgi:hypothetical protein